MEQNDKLILWAQGHSGTINGVTPARLPGRGWGMIATRPIKRGERLIHIPTECLLTPDSKSMPTDLLQTLTKCSVHGQLAGQLAYHLAAQTSTYSVWLDVMPSWHELQSSMPLLWSTQIKNQLPLRGARLLSKQRLKYDRDLGMAMEYFSSLLCKFTGVAVERSVDLYKHAWLLVNTRSFFWDISTSVRGTRTIRKPKARLADDCMALCPVIDCFNHSDIEDCGVSYNGEGFSVTSLRDIEDGAELYVSYGKHCNDFLMVEYGFLLEKNKEDYLLLDAVLLGWLSETEKELLRRSKLLGNFTLNSIDGICFRSQAALRIMRLPRHKWESFICGVDTDEQEQDQVDALYHDLLKEYATITDGNIAELKLVDRSVAGCKALLTRWEQARQIIGVHVRKL